jgi:hypothetical protein
LWFVAGGDWRERVSRVGTQDEAAVGDKSFGMNILTDKSFGWNILLDTARI